MDDLISKLTALGIEEAKAKEIAEKAKADGVTDLAGAALINEGEWIGYGATKVAARKLVADLNKPAAPPAPAAPVASPFAMTSVLPAVPDDGDFLKLLQVGGTLEMQPTDVIAAVRVTFAQRYGLFDIDEKIVAAMELRAEELKKPYTQPYYDIRRELSRKKYADVLQALDVPGNIVTERNKKAFLGKLAGIWDVLSDFQTRIDAWQSAWQTKMSNPGVLFSGIAAMMSGGAAAGAASGLVDAPDTAPVLDAATSVIDSLNEMFAGAGIPVARALAADAVQLRSILERSDIVAATGSASREEMIKKLGLAVTADTVRSEKSVTQYVLAVLKLPECPTTQLPMYIVALKELGANVPWDALRAGRVTDGRNPGTSLGGARQRGFTG